MTASMPLISQRDLEAERERLLELMEETVGKELSRQLQSLELEDGTVCTEPVLVETDGTFYANER